MMAKPVHLRAKRKASTWLLDFEKGPGTSINLWMELILKFEVGESLGAATGEWLCGFHCSLPQHHCLASSASALSSTCMCCLDSSLIAFTSIEGALRIPMIYYNHPIPCRSTLFHHLYGPWIDLSRPPMTSNNDLLCNDWLTDWLTYLVFWGVISWIFKLLIEVMMTVVTMTAIKMRLKSVNSRPLPAGNAIFIRSSI